MEATDGASARCGDCLAGLVESGGTCLPPACTRDETCLPETPFGPWGPCGGWVDACARVGTQRREVYRGFCDAWSCAIAASTEERACPEVRDTDGEPCGPDNAEDSCELGRCLPPLPAPVEVDASDGSSREAVNDAGPGPPSASVSGNRAVGAPSYQWAWSTAVDTSWRALLRATGPSAFDTDIAPGSPRLYRVRIEALGASPRVTGTTEGRRAPSLGVPCTADGDCPTGAWCPTDTTLRRCSPRPAPRGVALPFQAVPPGAFAMGAPPGEVGRDADEAPVLVTLSCAAFVQRTEVTQRQWMALSDGINPSCFQSADADTCSEAGLHPDGPVEQITWWSALGVHRQQPQPAGGFMERCPHVCPFREPQRRLAGHPQ